MRPLKKKLAVQEREQNKTCYAEPPQATLSRRRKTVILLL